MDLINPDWKTLLVYPKKGNDLAVNFAIKCAIRIKSHLRNAGIIFKELKGQNASRSNVQTHLVLLQNVGGNFLGFGHGMPDRLIGHANLPVLTIDDTPLLRDKVCYLLACCTGQRIGETAIAQGAKAYIGFRDAFMVTKYYRDDLMDCCISGIRDFLLGKCSITDIESVTDRTFVERERLIESKGDGYTASIFAYDRSMMLFLL